MKKILLVILLSCFVCCSFVGCKHELTEEEQEIYDKGYEEGYDEGQNDGYQEGYDDGYDDAQNEDDN